MAAGNNTGGDEWAVTDALPADVLAELARIVLAEETLDSVLSKVAGMAQQVIRPRCL